MRSDNRHEQVTALTDLAIDVNRQESFLSKIQEKTAEEINASIKRRRKKIEALSTEGRSDQILEWELKKLTEKKAEIEAAIPEEEKKRIDQAKKQAFIARIHKKNEKELRASIRVREDIIRDEKILDDYSIEWELEELKKRLQPYEREKLYKKNRSPTLEKDPKARLDHYHEIERYIGTFSPEYRKQVDELAAQIKEPMGSDVKIVSCIPAAGHQEGENIYQALKNYSFQKDYTGQRLKPESFEIVVFVNHPQVDKKGKTIKPDKTLSEIKRFQKNHPEVTVRFMYQALPQEQAKIGMVRKLLNDSVLMRHHARGKSVPDLIMVSNDADNKGVSPEYFAGFLEKFKDDPELEGILGQLDWDPEAYIRYPEVFIGTRLFQYLNARGRKRGRVPSSGANFAFRSSIFAGIGGYLSELEGGEDVAVGRAIMSARHGKKALGYSKDSLLYTSARRSIDMWEKNGIVPVQQWERGFSAFDELRKQDLDRSIEVNYDDPDVQKKLVSNLELVVNKTLDVYEAGEKLGKKNKMYRKTLNALGIRYNLSATGEIIITDISRLINKLKEYKELAVLHRDKKSGKPKSGAEYDERKRQLEQADVARQEQIKREYQSKYESFRNNTQIPEISSATKSSIEDSEKKLFASTDTSEIGDYVIVNDALIKNEADRTQDRAIKLGYNKTTNKVVVIKQINADTIDYYHEMSAGNEDREKFLVEKGLHHPNLQLPIDRFEKDGKIMRVYERGSIDLRTYLEERKKALSPQEAIAVMMPIIDATRDMHEHGVIHTDLSTSNIIFVGNDVKLIDHDEAGFTQGPTNKSAYKKGVRGNRFLLPPELMKPKTSSPNGETYKFDKTADIYEAAATLYQIIVGTWPHKVPKVERNIPEDPDAFEIFHKARFLRYAEAKINQPITFPDSVPSVLQEVLKKAMYPYSEGRYQSMEEFGLALMDAYEKI